MWIFSKKYIPLANIIDIIKEKEIFCIKSKTDVVKILKLGAILPQNIPPPLRYLCIKALPEKHEQFIKSGFMMPIDTIQCLQIKEQLNNGKRRPCDNSHCKEYVFIDKYVYCSANCAVMDQQPWDLKNQIKRTCIKFNPFKTIIN